VSAPHDVPTAAQLVESVREWLQRDVMTSTEGRLQFHARVAANVLSMVERELAAGDAQALAHASRLASLGVADDVELAEAIRGGSIDYRDRALLTAMTEAVADKLAVANPAYDLPRD
jgi:hypothetical protein